MSSYLNQGHKASFKRCNSQLHCKGKYWSDSPKFLWNIYVSLPWSIGFVYITNRVILQVQFSTWNYKFNCFCSPHWIVSLVNMANLSGTYIYFIFFVLIASKDVFIFIFWHCSHLDSQDYLEINSQQVDNLKNTLNNFNLKRTKIW